MTVAYLECFSGISGDMFLGVLVDAGVPVGVLQRTVDALKLGASLRIGKVDRSGIGATKVDVMVGDRLADEAGHAHTHGGLHEHTHEHGQVTTHSHSHESHTHSHEHGRSLKAIRGLIEGAEIASEAKALAIRAFDLLGRSEAKIHNVPLEQIHFHEVGAVDAIVDIVATAAGCTFLGVETWYCSPLNVGAGSVDCAHGTFPVPAPATLDLLAGAPIYAAGPRTELLTPTGAALLRALDVRFDAVPVMRPGRMGYGAGSKEFSQFPNVVRLTLGEVFGAVDEPTEITGVIETTIDDTNPQVIAYVADLLLEEGAAEVFRTPVQMKKGRTGVLMTILCAPESAGCLREVLFRETSTIGLRYREERKFVLEREFSSVETEWGGVRMKVARLPGGHIANVAPEFEDCKRIAQERGVPLKRVMEKAVRAFGLKYGEAEDVRLSEAKA